MLSQPHTAFIPGKLKPYTSDENALLVRLKEKKAMSWSEITTHFPGRNMSSLQVHYSTKLRHKASSRSGKPRRREWERLCCRDNSWLAPVDMSLYTTSSVAVCFNTSIKCSCVLCKPWVSTVCKILSTTSDSSIFPRIARSEIGLYALAKV